MKKITLLLFVFLLLFPHQTTYAEEKEEKEEQSSSCEAVFSETAKAGIEKYHKEEASIQEGYAIDLITSLVNFAGINSIANLVFGNPYCIWSDEEPELVYGIFTTDEQTKIIDPMITMLKGTFSFLLTLTMMLAALKLTFTGLSGARKSEFWQEVKMWFVVLIFLMTFDLFIEALFIMNQEIVQGFRSYMEADGLDYKSLSFTSTSKEYMFTDIIVFLAEWLLALYLNFLYIFRKVIILLLILLAPIAGFSLLYPASRHFFGTWVRELCGMIFIQSFHGIILTLFLMLSTLVSGASGTVFKMILLILFIPLTGMIMSWLKLSQSNNAMHRVGMMGVSSAAQVARASKMVMSRRNPFREKNINLANQSKTKISSLADGKHSKLWNGVKSGVGTTGALIGGTAGMVLGPQGSQLGASLGKGFSLAALQGSRNIGAFGGNIHRSFKELKGSGSFKEGFRDISKRREFFGNLGESTGALVGFGGAGRQIGHAFSGVSRQRLLNSNELGGLGGANLDHFSQMYPGQDVKWLQNNQGSAFYLDRGNDNLERISPIGRADPLLSDGINREIGYQFSNVQPNLKMNENGAYSSLVKSPLSGSTEHLHRTSDVFLKGMGGSTMDTTFNPRHLNPADYYKPGLQGAEMRNTGDRVADAIHGVGNRLTSQQAPRHRGFV
ncbi:hypothetical protein [Metabacillus fastidiosus]|uniref:hypothetical protein n=1 Tax=Metabacillus fastidiosus TaxID=1458 RepID=UPI003D2B3D8B